MDDRSTRISISVLTPPQERKSIYAKHSAKHSVKKSAMKTSEKLHLYNVSYHVKSSCEYQQQLW